MIFGASAVESCGSSSLFEESDGGAEEALFTCTLQVSFFDLTFFEPLILYFTLHMITVDFPAFLPVTFPLLFTVAILLFFDDHFTDTTFLTFFVTTFKAVFFPFFTEAFV